MKKLILLILASLIAACGEKTADSPTQKIIAFKNPELITQGELTPEKLSVSDITTIWINDYFDFSKNSQEMRQQLSIKTTSSCLNRKEIITKDMASLNEKVFVHELLEHEDLQKLLTSGLICNFSFSISNKTNTYIKSFDSLSITSIISQSEDLTPTSHETFENSFEFSKVSTPGSFIICENFVFQPKNAESSAYAYIMLRKQLNDSKEASYSKNKFSQTCAYAEATNGYIAVSNPFEYSYELPKVSIHQRFFVDESTNAVLLDFPMRFITKLPALSLNFGMITLRNNSSQSITLRLPKTQKVLWMGYNFGDYLKRVRVDYVNSEVKTTNDNHSLFSLQPGQAKEFQLIANQSDVENSCVSKHPRTGAIKGEYGGLGAYTFASRLSLYHIRPVEIKDHRGWHVVIPAAADFKLEDRSLNSEDASSFFNTNFLLNTRVESGINPKVCN